MTSQTLANKITSHKTKDLSSRIFREANHNIRTASISDKVVANTSLRVNMVETELSLIIDSTNIMMSLGLRRSSHMDSRISTRKETKTTSSTQRRTKMEISQRKEEGARVKTRM